MSDTVSEPTNRTQTLSSSERTQYAAAIYQMSMLLNEMDACIQFAALGETGPIRRLHMELLRVLMEIQVNK